MSGRWLHRRPQAEPSARLVCLPHAGGTAGGFAGWADRTPPGTELVAVQYPGRQNRLGDPPLEDMAELADEVAGALRGLPDLAGVPLVLFGHSMGSGLAHEVARRLARDAGIRPVHLFVSARPAPHHVRGEHRHRLSDADLVAAMRALEGPDSEVYDHAELLPVILPPLRADLRLLDRYRPASVPPVDCPITALGGADDHTCPVAQLDTWAEVTTAGARTVVLPGGHHYLREREDEVLALVSGTLRAPADRT